jgi:hypothetical protein
MRFWNPLSNLAKMTKWRRSHTSSALLCEGHHRRKINSIRYLSGNKISISELPNQTNSIPFDECVSKQSNFINANFIMLRVEGWNEHDITFVILGL